jgi:hypothetical protein
MFRRSFIIGFLLAASLSSTICLTADGAVSVSGEGKDMQEMGVFVHTVLFWFNENADESKKRQLIDDCKSLLGSISTVRFLAVGTPAGTSRSVVDNSYDVGLIVHFEDEAGHEHYQTAEKHLKFIERNRDTWARVQVYDIQAE